MTPPRHAGSKHTFCHLTLNQALLDDTLMEQSRKVHGGETETAPGDPGADGAPAAGLEPATVRLTVGCSAN